MRLPNLILNERDLREARTLQAEISAALSSAKVFDSVIAGLPHQVVDGYRRSLEAHTRELNLLIEAYEAAKGGDYEDLKKRAGADPGLALIVARISNQLSQKDLARRLGLKEQQIQRYELDRYRSISLANFQKIASALNVHWEMNFSKWLGSPWGYVDQISMPTIKKLLRHAQSEKWFAGQLPEDETEGLNYVHRYISEHVSRHGSPSLLRTGLNVKDHTGDLLLLAWKARVTKRAEQVIEESKPEYRPLSVNWLLDLIQQSKFDDGPARAKAMLLQQGIVLVAERQIMGMKIDGAAFLVGGVPVIGLTVRRDTVDGFWYTLMHEVAHVILHYRTGLTSGFFDESEATMVDELEAEADEFASNILIPEERWRRAPARIAKSAAPVEAFASQIGIHSAIVYGRIQKERNDYATFSNKIGRGQVRKYLFQQTEHKDVEH